MACFTSRCLHSNRLLLRRSFNPLLLQFLQAQSFHFHGIEPQRSDVSRASRHLPPSKHHNIGIYFCVLHVAMERERALSRQSIFPYYREPGMARILLHNPFILDRSTARLATVLMATSVFVPPRPTRSLSLAIQFQFSGSHLHRPRPSNRWMILQSIDATLLFQASPSRA